MKKSRVYDAIGVAGEVLITVGVLALLFLAWQLWINNAFVARDQQKLVAEQSQQWNTVSPTPSEGAKETWPAPAVEKVDAGKVIGNLYIPRLGESNTRAIGESVTPELTLNRGYFGHYSDTQMPGENGNFALAVHRSGWGTGFKDAQLLQTGDRIYIETESGFYGYTVRNMEYVLPTSLDVLAPAPGSEMSDANQSIMTITTCSPQDGNVERLVVYAVLDSYRDRVSGPFPDLAPMMKQA